MQLIVAAVGHKMPAWIEAGFQEYAKRMPRSLPIEMLDWTNTAFHPLANPDAAGCLPVEGPGFRIALNQAVIDKHGVRVAL